MHFLLKKITETDKICLEKAAAKLNSKVIQKESCLVRKSAIQADSVCQKQRIPTHTLLAIPKSISSLITWFGSYLDIRR
jgi:hypothetical protein